jgi:hypothetical protein
MAEKIMLDKETIVEAMYRAHVAIQKEFTFNSNFIEYDKITIERTVSFNKAGNTRQLELAEERFSNSAIQLFPESAEYLFPIEGIAKKLFFFLLVHYVHPRTNVFLFNVQVASDFNAYNALLGGKKISDSNLSQGLRKLVKGNIIQNIERGKYMLNPVIAGGMSVNGRRTLIQEYSQLLIMKRKDPIMDFYPNGVLQKNNS